MLRTHCLFVALIAFSAPSFAAAPASPDPKSLIVPAAELSRARELVQQLGSEQFAEREEAEQLLAKMGRAARLALLEGVNSDPNAEVRNRCHTLLPKATALEMRARLEVFLADTEGKYEHDLPGWNQFRATVRGEWTFLGHPIKTNQSLDKAARVVFAELLSSPVNRHILLMVGTQETDLSSLAAARRQELYSQKYPRVMVVGGMVTRPTAQRDPTLADMATLLFVEAQAGPKFVPPRTASMSILLSSSGFTTAATSGDERGKVFQAIAVAWLDTRRDPIDMQNAISIASQVNLPESACRIAVRLFESKGATVFYRGNAAATLARLGNASHVPMLEKAMADNAVLTTIRKAVAGKPVNEWETHEIQIRDVALAVSMIILQQNPEDYGFVDQYRANGINGATYNYTRYYLPDGKRDAAFAKWKEWREKQK